VTSVHGLTPSKVILAMLLSFSPMVLQAANEVPIDMSVVQLEPKEQNGITYLSGGVGQDESQAIQQVRGYNLHITLSSGPDNKYLSGVDVVIQTAKGRSIVSLSQVGPIVYVKLPADNYVIIASQNGHEKRSTVVLEGSSTGTVNLHWSD
jgi:hypothetical protein